ncbi:MAG: site-2 protease family protein [Nitrospirota bacterium]
MKQFPYLQVILFLLTLLSTVTVGALQTGVDLLKEPEKIYTGLPFALSLLLILLSHELSHYFASKKHGVKATLPYFIPAPTIIGTFGAFIKMQSPLLTRASLIDIGASGPIAGFLLSVVATVTGLHFSDVIPTTEAKGVLHLGDSILFSSLCRVVLGPTPAGYDIFLHPIAFAGWIGLFVTSINLIPVGQLDGGHIVYALIREKQTTLSVLLIIVMVVLGLAVWEGWIFWSVVLVVLGVRHPPVFSWEVPLDPARRFAAWLSALILVLTFIPVPFQIL